ncbi:MAG: bifunctional diaminohydroxyphosphoribosylaminopyrimidine deaminase/5-amino-6-(5-phosphoribosylamino)uracil reductase RibD [Nitrospirales bacterium]|nr:bifunctional diaminohydroxyphosphoribosylaminopyrimidine deaminase/5-amino-6-(5-phosphoribosylamino)uracil reductase RibD [Nitrospirales bacterium]MBA3754096.1 bifunctional diaminohydroxyphosphoribosylaminopyrimidine deaminase/5-amino-6-(5-phosphoribosylamino)uracil reductase RibD [Nitrospira sp.]
MKRALRLAAKGRGRTSPNPMVGAVIVSRSRIVGQGYHHRAGDPHAEVLALRAAGKQARGGTLYVTLEPCCHTRKRTPPCVPVLVESGLRRVVVATPDPNPQVKGRGVSRLRRACIDVTVGCCREEAEQLNEAYIHWITTGRPFLTLKAAMTLDGKIATAGGDSRWITGREARLQIHRLRGQVDAVMVGIGTVLHDDPQLTARPPGSKVRQPVRVILDSRLRIPLNAKVLSTKGGGEVVIVTTRHAATPRIENLQRLGATIVIVPAEHGRVSLNVCLTELGKRGITSVLLEGGSELNASALSGGLVHRLQLYVAPTLLGGQNAKGVFGGTSPTSLTDAQPLKDVQLKRIGRDVFIDAMVATRSKRTH